MSIESTAKKNAVSPSSLNREYELPPQIDASSYSKEHQASIALMEEFYYKVKRQEDMYVAAGFPAEGLTGFLGKWYAAWEARSADMLRSCVTDDIVWADPTFGSRDVKGTIEDFDLYMKLFKLAPDMVFYAQSGGQKALPCYDFLDGKVRITAPWRMIAKFKFTPRTVNIVGVDRYDMVLHPERGWLIERIDTDLDLLFFFGQLMPFKPIRGIPRNALMWVLRQMQKAPSLRTTDTDAFVYDLQSRR